MLFLVFIVYTSEPHKIELTLVYKCGIYISTTLTNVFVRKLQFTTDKPGLLPVKICLVHFFENLECF